MRSLSANAQNIFSQSGIEPIILIRVFWNSGNGIIYSDRRFTAYGFEGKLISVGTIDDVVNVNNSSNTAQVSVVLDDSDGTLKQIFNTSDIHKTQVQLLQWCTDLAPNEAFVIFTGQISSPIEWKESDRTLSFDVVTLIEDKLVGFSVEQGNFALFPSKLIGKAWPIIFGSVSGVPALQILDTPTAILAEPIAIVDDKVWQQEMNDLDAQRRKALENARNAFLNGIGEALVASRYKGEASGGFNFSFVVSDDPQTAQSHDLAADNYYAQSAAFTDDATNIARQMSLKQELWDLQKSYDKMAFRVNTINLPSGVSLRFKLGSATYTGTYVGGMFFVSDRKFPEDYNHRPYVNITQRNETTQGVKTSDIYGNGPQQVEFGQKFQWIDGGTEIHIDNLPLTFVVSIGPVAVGAIWAKRRGVRCILPSNYYIIENRQFGNTICTLVTLIQPLTGRTFFNGVNQISEGWDSDQIEVDCTSTIGPNTIDIMIWIIALYTKFGIDWSSFNAVKVLLNNYPMNFAMLEHKNVIQFLQELAFQARCSIWLNDGVFFIRYLPIPPTPVDTITNDDVVYNSLSITCTETENLVTMFTATWKPNLFQDDFKIIYQYNIPRYGLVESSYNFYAYNNEELVKKSAEFWMIRKSNSFKIVKFKTSLHKIKLETFDGVTVNFDIGLVANGPVVGTIQKATYNTKDKTIDIEIWLPVRFGEMDVFPFAEPYSETSIYPRINDPNLKTDNPFELAGLFPQQQYIIESHSPFQHLLPSQLPSIFGRGGPIGDFEGPPGPTNYGPVDTMAIDPSNIGSENLRASNGYLQYNVNPIAEPMVSWPSNGSFPGIVTGTKNKGAQQYNVDVFFNGLSGTPKNVVVKQFSINANDEVSSGTPVEVHRLAYRTSDGFVTADVWMQAPIWQPAKESDEGGIGDSGGGTSPPTSTPPPPPPSDPDGTGEEDTGTGGTDAGDVTNEGAGEESSGGDFGGGGEF